MAHLWPLALTAFVACSVEAAEAITIVLAVGTAYNWRSALLGALAAVVTLIVLVGAGGAVLLTIIPIRVVRIVVGAFLIYFGYSWLRKSVLRFAGRMTVYDEGAKYEKRVAALRDTRDSRGGLAVAFNGVFLEGLEVAIIVITVGSSSTAALETALGAALVACIIMTGIAALLRKPFSRVPENQLKFVVGTMLVSFGIFWLGEGVGIAWWHDEVSLLVLIVAMFALAFATIAALRRPSVAHVK
jgi:uncharacterized membrane protein